MNPDGYWVTGVLEPIEEGDRKDAVREAGSHLSRSTLGGDTVKWIGRSTLVVMSTIAIVATGA